MSADNWGICPKCKQKQESLYGKVSEEEYLKTLNKKNEYTLREDYEIYTDENGKFHIDYACSCSKCKFTFEYAFSKNIL